jgi:iron(III) transport system ATP-binding protein
VAEVTISKVTKKFGEVTAVDGFDALIKHGEFISILGPSGCGKTTMLRIIAGFEKATEGEVRLGDLLVSSSDEGTFVPPERRNIGMVFQSYAVWPHMNVFDNVSYPLKIKKCGKAEIEERTMRALDLVHLNEYAHRFPNQLSGGQQQRVALARALVGEPRLLLLDEPLSNLDAKLRETMRFEIKELQKKLDVTVIYVTHDQAEAMAMSDRIIVMHNGKIQQVDKPTKIYEDPVNATVADFIGLVNFIEAEALEDGLHIPVVGCTLPVKTTIKGRAIAAIRPEHIHMNRDGRGIKGKVIRKFYLGDSTDCRVAVGDQILRVIGRGSAFTDFLDDEEVYLEFSHVMAFPATA